MLSSENESAIIKICDFGFAIENSDGLKSPVCVFVKETYIFSDLKLALDFNKSEILTVVFKTCMIFFCSFPSSQLICSILIKLFLELRNKIFNLYKKGPLILNQKKKLKSSGSFGT